MNWGTALSVGIGVAMGRALVDGISALYRKRKKGRERDVAWRIYGGD